MVEVLHGDIFLYPNSLQICEDVGEVKYSVDGYHGLQVCAEVWITSQESGNWNDSGHPRLPGIISRYFPVDLFYGKKEGDTVETSIRGIPVILKCSQSSYRYAGYGCFENLLYSLTRSFGGCVSPSYYKPPLSEASQRCFLIANHEKYARSLNLPVIESAKFKYA